MIDIEPTIAVGILQHQTRVHARINGTGLFNRTTTIAGTFQIVIDGSSLVLLNEQGSILLRDQKFECIPTNGSTVTFLHVTIGIKFHWEQTEAQTFAGSFRFMFDSDGTFAVINDIQIEQYLESVVASEMCADAPLEFLKAHAIISRSWLLAMIAKKKNSRPDTIRSTPQLNELATHSSKTFIIERWYDREDHTLFDVCADDHCQRYQGLTKDRTSAAAFSVRSTRGLVLMYNNEICDARFHKACGGRTEDYATAWEDKVIPYLQSVVDGTVDIPPLVTEETAGQWIQTQSPAYCNVTDESFLQTILPSYDLKTTHFYRWHVVYKREELEEIVTTKSTIDLGTLIDIQPLKRGPSGRLSTISLKGTKATLVVGKELEIRRILSSTHLYSSAFIIDIKRDSKHIPQTITLCGAGWGHGVGLCQIGAATMAQNGHTAQSILAHYYRNAEIKKFY